MKLNNIDNIKIINLEHINTKESSMLIFNKIENYMKVKRVFFVNPKSKDVIKGKHAHKIDNQIICCINGKIRFTVKDGKKQKSFILSSPKKLIYVPKHIWTETKYLNEETKICVFSSSEYNENSYIRFYTEYLEFRKLK